MADLPSSEASQATRSSPYEDIPSWWSYVFAGGYSWRWFTSPHLYFSPGLEYEKTDDEFTVIDGLGREKTYHQPFECYIDPLTGKISKLYVQAPASLCRMPADKANNTWKRTPIRNATPILQRIANLPFRLIPPERRGEPWSRLTGEDRLKVVMMWLPTVAVFLVSVFTLDPGAATGKDQNKYLPFMYRGLRYPRLARNVLENREQVAQRLRGQSNKTVLSTYRTFRPRFLNYLVEIKRDGRTTFESERLPVEENDFTPFIMVCYSSEHYRLGGDELGNGDVDSDDLELLLAVSTKAAVAHFQLKPGDLDKGPRAFWTSANCMPPDEIYDKEGPGICKVDGLEREVLANQDTYSISDIIRAAKHVVIVAGNRSRPWADGALRVWGERIWTLPEVILSKGDSVTVWHCGDRPEGRAYEMREIPKALLPTEAWPDAHNARQLLEHYTNLHLSRLELVKIALECLMSRRFRPLHAGDRVYVLMGLLRIRPPIDKSDTAFQAFARLSLPQDSDRLMERLICLLPNAPDENWELMTDQYHASLWDIYPDTQVCAIGENDTVVVDGFRGAQIQWSHFDKVRALRRETFKRAAFVFILSYSPLLFFIGIIIAGTSAPPRVPAGSRFVIPVSPAYQAGVAIVVVTLVLFLLPVPYFLWTLFSGKLWAVEPCFFGIEGYVPLSAIEERLFGMGAGAGAKPRLRWSAYGSPLSRHKQGERMLERAVHYHYPDSSSSSSPLLSATHENDTVSTYPIETIDPTSPCSACLPPNPPTCRHHPTPASCHAMSTGAAMGEMKVFTLVDTYNLTVTLFHAVRPPTVLLVGGSEGGTKRAIACSLDMTTGTLYRETVLRIPSQSADRMESVPRVRLGLRRPFVQGDVRRVRTGGTVGGGGAWKGTEGTGDGRYNRADMAAVPISVQQQRDGREGVNEVTPVGYEHEPKV